MHTGKLSPCVATYGTNNALTWILTPLHSSINLTSSFTICWFFKILYLETDSWNLNKNQVYIGNFAHNSEHLWIMHKHLQVFCRHLNISTTSITSQFMYLRQCHTTRLLCMRVHDASRTKKIIKTDQLTEHGMI